MSKHTFFGAVLAVHAVVLCRRPDVRQCKVDLVDDALHGGQNQLAETVFGVRTLGHDVGFERDECLGARHDFLCVRGMGRGEPSDLRENAECCCRSHVVVEAESHERHDEQRAQSPSRSRVGLHCDIRGGPSKLVVSG